MSSVLDEALSLVMKHEGGYVNDPNDAGGETNFGISKRFLNGLPHTEPLKYKDIKTLTQEEACELYKKYFWAMGNLNRIVNNKLAIKVMDMAVNMGLKTTIKLLQKAANKMAENVSIVEDGVIGSNTANAINFVPQNKLLANFINECVDHYQSIVEKKPSNGKYLHGWINRVNDFGSLYS